MVGRGAVLEKEVRERTQKNQPFSTALQHHYKSAFNGVFTFITLQTKTFSILGW